MSFAGTWNTRTQSPMGNQEGTLVVDVDGQALTGRIAGPQGEMPIEEGRVDGDKATWTVNVTSPMPVKLEFDATLEGEDAIRGTVKLGAFGTATFEGTRA